MYAKEEEKDLGDKFFATMIIACLLYALGADLNSTLLPMFLLGEIAYQSPLVRFVSINGALFGWCFAGLLEPLLPLLNSAINAMGEALYLALKPYTIDVLIHLVTSIL